MLWRWVVGGVLGVAGAAAAEPPAAPHDLTGTWTNAWSTELQRPKDFQALKATPEEAEAYEKPRRALNGMIVEKDDELGQAEAEFNDKGPGLARIRGEIRTSWIVDPVDGRIPYADGSATGWGSASRRRRRSMTMWRNGPPTSAV